MAARKKKRVCKFGKRKTDGKCRKTPVGRRRRAKGGLVKSDLYPDIASLAGRIHRISCKDQSTRVAGFQNLLGFMSEEANLARRAPLSETAKNRRVRDLKRIARAIANKGHAKCAPRVRKA